MKYGAGDEKNYERIYVDKLFIRGGDILLDKKK